jgi:hypothetical protein
MFTAPVKVLVPTGSLGAGAREDEVRHGIAQGAHAIATDAGSTDSGAAYLALGISKNNRGSVKRDLTILMKASAEEGIPLIVGSCGQAGGDRNVDWTLDIALEVARELGIRPRIAVSYSEQSKETIKAENAAGRVHPLALHAGLDDATIDGCDHIVAVLGPEPYIAALEAGANIVLGEANDGYRRCSRSDASTIGEKYANLSVSELRRLKQLTSIEHAKSHIEA